MPDFRVGTCFLSQLEKCLSLQGTLYVLNALSTRETHEHVHHYILKHYVLATRYLLGSPQILVHTNKLLSELCDLGCKL